MLSTLQKAYCGIFKAYYTFLDIASVILHSFLYLIAYTHYFWSSTHHSFPLLHIHYYFNYHSLFSLLPILYFFSCIIPLFLHPISYLPFLKLHYFIPFPYCIHTHYFWSLPQTWQGQGHGKGAMGSRVLITPLAAVVSWQGMLRPLHPWPPPLSPHHPCTNAKGWDEVWASWWEDAEEEEKRKNKDKKYEEK